MPDASDSLDDSSDCGDAELARVSWLVRQYDSLEDAQLKSDFLEERGLTRPVIDSHRRFIARAVPTAPKAFTEEAAAMDKRAEPSPGAPSSEGRSRPRQQRRARPRRRPVALSGPPGRRDIRRRRRRTRTPERPRRYLVVIIPLPP